MREDSTIPYGYCHCGCGEKTPLIEKNHTKRGYVKGEPRLFIRAHQNRTSPVRYREEDRGYSTPCHIWQWAIHHSGYGAAFDGKMMRSAHLVIWEQIHGEVPDGLELDHLCNVRACVNPDHLEAVTPKVNVRRRLATKLNESSVREIRQMRHTMRLTEIAAVFGVAPETISSVVHRRSWKDVA